MRRERNQRTGDTNRAVSYPGINPVTEASRCHASRIVSRIREYNCLDLNRHAPFSRDTEGRYSLENVHHP